jgi:hypothetical protein
VLGTDAQLVDLAGREPVDRLERHGREAGDVAVLVDGDERRGPLTRAPRPPWSP